MLEKRHQMILLEQRTKVSNSNSAICWVGVYRADALEQNGLLIMNDFISEIPIQSKMDFFFFG